MKDPFFRKLPPEWVPKKHWEVNLAAITGTKPLETSITHPPSICFLSIHCRSSGAWLILAGMSWVGFQAAVWVQICFTCLIFPGPASQLGHVLPLAMLEAQGDTPNHTSTFQTTECVTSASNPRPSPRSRGGTVFPSQGCGRFCKVTWQRVWMQKR